MRGIRPVKSKTTVREDIKAYPWHRSHHQMPVEQGDRTAGPSYQEMSTEASAFESGDISAVPPSYSVSTLLPTTSESNTSTNISEQLFTDHSQKTSGQFHFTLSPMCKHPP